MRGLLPLTNVYGIEVFMGSQFEAFPRTRTASVTLNEYSAGISVGTSSKPVSERDYQLDSPITSGINIVLTSTSVIYNDGAPYLQYDITVTNTSSSTVNLREIGYKQTVNCHRYGGDTASSAAYVVMIDRTLIEPAITLGPSEAAVVQYRLMTVQEEPSVVDGVTIVSWEFGTDEQVSAMITAARNGTIDLSDYWQVGDMREVEVTGFTSGGVTNDTQTIDLVITAFGDYNGCGSVMQVDFAEQLEKPIRMHSSNTNSGGYGSSEMATTTLPALVTKLPSWLQSLMLTFSVLTSAGGNSDDIESVEGNKLALRSQMEVRGGHGNSKAGEGSAIAWYNTDNITRQKRRGRSGSTNTYWYRSPAGNTTQYAAVNRADASSDTTVNASTANGVAPFMCL